MAREYRFDIEICEDEDVEELFGILGTYGPYLTHDGYDYIAFRDPGYVTEGYRDPVRCQTIPQWHLFEVYSKDLEAERAAAETVGAMWMLGLDDDEIRGFMEDHPDAFDVSETLMNDQLKKIGRGNRWFELPEPD